MQATTTAKAVLRSEVNALTHDYLEHGGEIHSFPERASSGLNGHDWKRLCQGLKVATADDIAVETKRRAIIAVQNKDLDLAVDLIRGIYRADVKSDIENDRGGPQDIRALREGHRLIRA